MQLNEQMIGMILLSANVFVPIIVLIIIYNYLIRKQVGFKIGAFQAILPIMLGVISLLISFAITLALGISALKLGIYPIIIPYPILRSFYSAFLLAAFPEEFAKLMMILISCKIFNPKNVHEYILIGFAVGMGFTFFEEYLYGSGTQIILRFFFFPFHPVFASLMAENLGLAARNRKIGKRDNFGLYLKAFFIPVIVHTIYDAATVKNFIIEVREDYLITAGIAFALVVLICSFIFIIRLLIRYFRLAPEYSHLLTN